MIVNDILIEIGKIEVVPVYVKRLRAKIVKIQAQLSSNSRKFMIEIVY